MTGPQGMGALMPLLISRPTVTINQGSEQPDPALGGSVVFDVVFSEAVTGFSTGDVTLSGTAGATTATVTGSGAIYTVTVTGMTALGTVIASIAANVATSVATGASNQASTSIDNNVDWIQISGVTWFRWEVLSELIVGDPVETLEDYAGGDAILTQGTVASRPDLVLSATPNGHQAIRFDGVNDYLFESDEVVSSSYTIHGLFLINVNRGASGTRCIWGWGGTADADAAIRLMHNPITNDYILNYSDNAGVDRINVICDASASGWDIVEFRKGGTSSSAFVRVIGGASGSVGSHIGSSGLFNRHAIGACLRSTATLFMDGDFAAGFGFQDLQSSDTIDALVDYLTDMYLL